MPSASHSQSNSRLAAFVAVMLALAVPLRANGVAVEQAAMGLALIGALVLLALDMQTRRTLADGLQGTVAKLAFVVFGAWAFTVAFSIDPVGSTKLGGRTALFALGVAIVWSAIRAHSETHPLALKTLLCASTVINILVLAALAGMPYIMSIMRGRFGPEHAALGYKAYAAAVLCLIPVAVWAGRRLGGKWLWLGYAFVPAAIAIIVLTSNRASLAGILAMVVVFVLALIVANPKNRYAVLLTGGAAAAAAGILAWVHHVRISLTVVYAESPYFPPWLIDPHRQNIWRFALEKFQEQPWVGHGIDQLNRLQGAHQTVEGLGKSAHLVPSHPHNWLLEVLSETGLIGTVPLVFALAIVAWTLLKGFARDRDEGKLAQLVLMAGFWASALFNFSIWAVWWELVFFGLFGFISATNVTAVQARAFAKDPPTRA